jgi:protein-L-isoaspartate(D-aspartate) O-methyltransferase
LFLLLNTNSISIGSNFVVLKWGKKIRMKCEVEKTFKAIIFTSFMRPNEDTYRHKGLRKKLTEVIRTKGITDERILEAINRIPRHFFLDSAFDDVAYEDRAFPIGEGQTISQPYTVAYQTFLLQVKSFEKVLEIGTGSVYQACVLAELGAQVYTIERQKKLFDTTKPFLS